MKYIKTTGFPKNVMTGIGHCFHLWALGFILAKKYNCEFIHTEFTSKIRNKSTKDSWEKFLNFGCNLMGEKNININTIKKITLPRIDLGHKKNIKKEELNKLLSEWGDIINNSEDERLFILQQNQGIGILSEEIYPLLSDHLKKCYWSNNEKYDFKNDLVNVVVHIRRGDIRKRNNSNRWLEISDYKKQLDFIRKKYGEVKFHVLSEGKHKDFDLIKNNDVKLYINHNDLDSFNMMCSSDILITGLSSFSVLASYLTKGLVFYNSLLNFTRWGNIENFYNIKNYV
jgi:hypothetical protein